MGREGVEGNVHLEVSKNWVVWDVNTMVRTHTMVHI